MKEIRDYIENISKLLPLNTSISYTEAENRAAKFLHAMAKITDWRHEFAKLKIQYESVQTAILHEQLSKGTGKTVTENKLAAEASKEYMQAREEFENIENDISYLKAYYDILNNAHVFFRNVAKGENF